MQKAIAIAIHASVHEYPIASLVQSPMNVRPGRRGCPIPRSAASNSAADQTLRRELTKEEDRRGHNQDVILVLKAKAYKLKLTGSPATRSIESNINE